MTTNIRVVSAPDLTSDNEVINLHGIPLSEGKATAGVCWFVVDYPAFEALLTVVKFVFGQIWKKFPNHQMWLLAGTSAWQRDTRIVRHRKLWDALSARGIKISHASNAQELVHNVGNKLKFFGASQISELSLESVVRALLEERCTYLALLPRAIGPENILDIGWSGDLAEDLNLVAVLTDSGGLLIKQCGEFDDKERGVIAVGQPETIELLLN